ncbi:PAS domain-containing sensor histidine kinase [Aureliella helgolandensis]|uniref:histidine kinase n=1 Tax=Aureliella helgolandensis TaxID=2527968 RepID=A0A518GHQ7_9BACT|nr:ATP-binding protein [Aureliella helgolandensis]QDV28131.1 Alkaline phosphatase synthesis sensor protein PhoR [Aureliella helgolandensis]
MISGRASGIARESMTLLVTCGCMLFLIGFIVSQQTVGAGRYSTVSLAIGGLAVTCVVVAMLRYHRRLSLPVRLERQLSAFANNAGGSAEVLHPVLDRTSFGQGWNDLIQRFQERQADQIIERRVDQSSVNRTGTERFARALRSISEGVAITDSHGKFSYANAAWSNTTTGVHDIECNFEGGSIYASLEEMKFHNWKDVEAKLTEGTKPIKVELHQGGHVSDGVLQLARNPLVGRSQESDGFVWMMRDVTQLALAREAHEQFLASATHELRTPLTNIRAYSESLIDLEDISPAQQKEFFNIIHSEAGRLSRLLNQLLDIQQLEAGSMTLTISSFDVQRMVHEVQEHIGPLVKEKQLKFVSRIAPNLKTIHADKEKVISCLVNLLGNAVKYTSEGGEVRLQAEQFEEYISISVEDSGIGIAPEELPKIFERFYRCQDERVATIEGNGLGLSFAREVALLHHGELTVESEINKGSRFILKIPNKN